MLLLDLGGVLFGFDDEQRVDRLGEPFGRSAQQVKEALWDTGFSADADAGRYPTAAEVRAQVRFSVIGCRRTNRIPLCVARFRRSCPCRRPRSGSQTTGRQRRGGAPCGVDCCRVPHDRGPVGADPPLTVLAEVRSLK